MISRKIVITKIQNKICNVLIEDGEIVELYCTVEGVSSCVSLGSIYIGKVKNIVPNINAAFIEIAKGVECYYDLKQHMHPHFTYKVGKKSLSIGDELLVQVQKEAIKTKVPTVTGNLNITGTYAILTFGSNRVGVSTKIDKAKRAELQQIARKYVSKEFGFIVRTNARDITEESLRKELEYLIEQYNTLMDVADTRTCFTCLKSATKPYISHIRDIYREGLTDILIEDSSIYEEVRAFVQEEQPECISLLKHYQDKLLPLHKLFSVESVLDLALREKVWMKSGAYLIIQPTEALTAIDVNTGKCVNKKKGDNDYLKINLEASKEVARQIRLRNLSGIILIDFINLDKKEDTQLLLSTLEGYLKKDPVTTVLVDITKLHLVEITRKKVRKSLQESVQS